MAALFAGLSIINKYNLVCRFDGVELVGNNDNGGASFKGINSAGYRHPGKWVLRSRRLIEQQYRCIF